MLSRHLLSAILLVPGRAAARAQGVRLYAPGEAVDPHEVAHILDNTRPDRHAIKTRSLRIIDEAGAAAPSQVAAQVASQASASALSSPVQFGFDSAHILPAARARLDALAEGVRMLPPRQNVIIEGHTDGRESARCNELLSQRRAQSVKRYLVAVQGIDPACLKPVGLGMDLPLPGHDPRAPEYRRVQFRCE
jgi:OmpA-OmpF porin, OOP family